MKVSALEFIGLAYYLMANHLLYGWQVEKLGDFVMNDNWPSGDAA